MTKQTSDLIELNRTFSAIHRPDIRSELESDIHMTWLFSEAESWEDLLKHRYVVVLGEAGAGKTTEMRFRVKKLIEEERYSVFIELNTLSNKGLYGAFSPDDNQRFCEWKLGKELGVFFLDSLDECNLQNQTIRNALRNLYVELEAEWSRVRLVISCRASDWWMFDRDRRNIEEFLSSGAGFDLHCVSLRPLSREQIRLLAELAGVNNVPQFLEALKNNNAQVLAERPLDVKWLGKYWNENRRIDNLSELIEHNVREKLRERVSRQSLASVSISDEKLELGCRTLAGIAGINNKWSFSVPDDTIDIRRDDDAVDPTSVLSDWSIPELQELLTRSVFDESTYGRVRIHHRSVQEFIAAKWLASLTSEVLDRERLEQLLFINLEGRLVIPSHLQPVVAWLALSDQGIRKKAMEADPSLLIEYGDPARIPNEERQEILRLYLQGYRDRSRRFDRFDTAALRRFSSSLSSEQILGYLSDSLTPDEFCEILFQIVEFGRISDCVDISLETALNQAKDTKVRCSAIAAVASVGNDEQKRSLLTLVPASREWDPDLALQFARSLYPSVLSITGFVSMITRVRVASRRSIDLGIRYRETILSDDNCEHQIKFLEVLLENIWIVNDSGKHEVPKKFRWLIYVVSSLVLKLMSDSQRYKSSSSALLVALELLSWSKKKAHRDFLNSNEVEQALSNSPNIRRELFWRRVDTARKRIGFTPTRYSKLRFSHIFQLGMSDKEWLAQDARNKTDIREQLLAFDTLIRLPCSSEERHAYKEFFREVSNSSLHLSKRFSRAFNPPYNDRYYWENRRWQRMDSSSRLSLERRESANRKGIEARIPDISEGTDINALWFLYHDAHAENSNDDKVDIESLRRKYSDKIADAAITGWRAIWRTHVPKLPNERERRNSVSEQTILGLVGLQLDFEKGLRVEQLSDDEVRITASYAACTLNGFPFWFAELVSFKPAIVVDTLVTSIADEFSQPNSGKYVHGILSKLSNVENTVQKVFSPSLGEMIRLREPPAVEVLIHALQVVLSFEVIDESLVSERCRRCKNDPKRFSVWWRCWLKKNAKEALRCLEDSLNGMEKQSGRQLVLQIGDQLNPEMEYLRGEHTKIDLEPEILFRLIIIFYSHIEPSAGIDSRVSKLSILDRAIDVRHRLIQQLENIPGKDSVATLRKLAEDERLSSIHDELLYRAERREVANASLTKPGIVSELTQLYKQHGTDAVNHLRSLQANPLVGIITIKEEEFKAVLDKLKPSESRRFKNRCYELAIVSTTYGDFQVAITRCNLQGNNFAQSAAVEFHQDMKPGYLLVVGIAGAVPTEDFGLGDVVVSSQIVDLTLEDTGSAQGMQRYDAQGGSLSTSVTRIVETLPAIERNLKSNWADTESIGCERPTFCGRPTTDNQQWNETLERTIKKHSSRNDPIAKAKKIASSDRLVKDPDLISGWLSTNKGIAAVEMESAGIYSYCNRNNIPFMAIRGISDIIGWKRDEAWTKYACHTAAAYVRMLIMEGAFRS